MIRILATGTIAALLVGSAAFAQAPVVYTWTGFGVNVPGSSKCPTYKMNIEVTVTGKAVKGVFQQEGRDQRHFETTLDKSGKIKTAAIVGGGNMMDVFGQISDSGSKIKLEGY